MTPIKTFIYLGLASFGYSNFISNHVTKLLLGSENEIFSYRNVLADRTMTLCPLHAHYNNSAVFITAEVLKMKYTADIIV